MIVSCGEALVDLVPDAVPGGGPMNVAVAVARLGASAAFIGAISTDPYGEMITAHLIRNGVNIDLCERVDASTARAIVEHVPQLRFRFEGEGTADTLLADANLARLSGEPHILHSGTLGFFRGRTAATLASLAEAHEGLVSFDPNVRPQIIDDRAAWDHFHDRWSQVSDLYKASDEDLAWIWPGIAPEDCAAELLRRGTSAVLVTRGADGVSVFTADGDVHVPAPTVDVVDTVGAGDTLIGATLVGLAESTSFGEIPRAQRSVAEWRRIAEGAVEAAAICCTRVGADPPRRSEVSW